MRESARQLEIEFPFVTGQLLEAARVLSARNEVRDGELYIELTRGEAPRYHPFPQGVKPTFFMLLNPLRKMPDGCRENGVEICSYPDLRGLLCHHKTINLLPNVLGKETAKRNHAYEACFRREDAHGESYITEGASSSFFAVVKGALITPELDNILPGATRAAVIDLACGHSIPVTERRIPLSEYLAADEAFLVSTVSQVMPVVGFDGKKIAGGQPGEMTKMLQALYNAFMLEHME
jgi:D-alanine transaminase